MKNGAIKYFISFTVLLLLTLNFVMACAQPQTSPPHIIPPKPATTVPPAITENQTPEESPSVDDTINEEKWYTIGTFSGDGNYTIPPFHIYGTEWRITWTIDAQDIEAAALDLLIQFNSPSGSIWKTITFKGSDSGNIIYLVEPEDNRDFFIKLIARSLQYWTITLEDNAPVETSHPVQISYIHYKGTFYPPDPEHGFCYKRVEPDEYVVIKNLSEDDQDMGGWVLKNISKPSPSFKFPSFPPYILAPGGIIRVYTDEYHPETGGLTFYYGHGDIWSNNQSDIAVLYDAHGKEISRKSYTVPMGINEANK